MSATAADARRLLRWLALLAVHGLLATSAVTHEIENDRLTIIQREATHVALTFRIDEIALLQRLLAPTASRGEFLLACAALSPAALTKKLETARAMFAAQLQLRDWKGRALRWTPLQIGRAHV